MRKLLCGARTVVIENTAIKIGNDNVCPPELIDSALGDMLAWLHLSLATLEAEYPSFEVLQAFHIFDLVADEEKCRRDLNAREEVRKSALKRLAQVYKRNVVRLAEQYYDFYPMAHSIHKSGEVSCTFEAWQTAVTRTQSRKASRELHPIDDLNPVLIELGAVGPSSS